MVITKTKDMRSLVKLFLMAAILFLPRASSRAFAQERAFADYFDIPVNCVSGTEVTGRIHLERNKDVPACPVPDGYRFEILGQSEEGLFRLETRRDLSGRIMGVFTESPGKRARLRNAMYKAILAFTMSVPVEGKCAVLVS